MARTLQTVIFLYLVALCVGKRFEKCELYKELKRQGLPENQLNDWMCLIEAESSRRTEVRGPPNSDGSYDHGLFQINDRYWCSASNTPGKECNVRCDGLRTDDITAAVTCAKKIFGISGFSAWAGWVNKCQGKPLPSFNC